MKANCSSRFSLSTESLFLAFDYDQFFREPGDARCYSSGTLLACFAVAYSDQQRLSTCGRA